MVEVWIVMNLNIHYNNLFVHLWLANHLTNNIDNVLVEDNFVDIDTV